MIHFGFQFWLLCCFSCIVKISPSVSFISSPVLIQFQETPEKSSVSLLNCSCSPDQPSALFPFILSLCSFGVSISSTFFLFHTAFNKCSWLWLMKTLIFLSSVFMAPSSLISPRPPSALGKYSQLMLDQE